MGYSSQKIPEGFPKKLAQFRASILHEGKPVENASVWLYPDDLNAKYHVRATTNTNGIASMETSINSYSKAGLPAGTFSC
ncbi:MAG: carboxypeptidase-like regulatory domain-containing protein [Planctomycetaceae bacterium]|nr:carboxypeptidase-like regulatory domain-containing protein [Planctomycetaceae bacterium]